MWRGIGGREFGFGLRDGGVGLVRVRNHSHPTVSWVERVLFWAGLAWLVVGVWSVWGLAWVVSLRFFLPLSFCRSSYTFALGFDTPREDFQAARRVQPLAMPNNKSLQP